MGYLTLEITSISAKDLKDVSINGKMDVYVAVSWSGEPQSKQKTPVHKDGGTNPSWNHTMTFSLDEATALKSNSVMIFEVKHEHTLRPDEDLGEIQIPVNELVNGSKGQSDFQYVSYLVWTTSGKAKGELSIFYKVTDKANAYPVGHVGYHAQASCGSSSYALPMTAYPTAPPGGYTQAPPAPPAGYPQTPPAGYPQTTPPPPTAYPQVLPAGYPQSAPPPPAGYPQASPQPAGYPQTPAAEYSKGVPPAGYPIQGGAVPYQSYGYPPPGYPPYGGYPAQPSYGYGYGYGYPPPAAYPGQPQKPKKSKTKRDDELIGVGAGLLGGLILGDILF